MVLFVSTAALVTAFVSCWFTWQQACVAQDGGYRAQRPYLIATASLTEPFFPSTIAPKISIVVVNKGQTPVYNMRGYFNADIIHFDMLAGRRHYLKIDCTDPDNVIGKTFISEDISVLEVRQDAVNENISILDSRGVLVSYGTACYEDVYLKQHTLRFCFKWEANSNSAQICDARNFEYPLGEKFDSPNECAIWPKVEIAGWLIWRAVSRPWW